MNQLYYNNGLIRNAGFECIKCMNCLLCHLTSAVPKKFSHINMHEQQSVIERMVVFILSGPRCNVSKDVLGAVSAIDAMNKIFVSILTRTELGETSRPE